MSNIALIAHNIRSTHNVGSLLRTAEGLGVQDVYLTGYTPYPKQTFDDRLPHIVQKLDKQIAKTALGAEKLVSWHHEESIKARITALKKEGFKVALDSITPDMAAYINLQAFDVDYIKINVSRDRTEQLSDPAIRKHLAQIPAERLIFFRCDNDKALATGLELGVSLFQGWLIDDAVSNKHD